jgi:hypothetical protein
MFDFKNTKKGQNLKQLDWNRQAQIELKKSIPEKESMLSKMLKKMSNEEILIARREQERENFNNNIRKKYGKILDANYLDQIIQMQPGVAETYFYELKKIVEHNE